MLFRAFLKPFLPSEELLKGKEKSTLSNGKSVSVRLNLSSQKPISSIYSHFIIEVMMSVSPPPPPSNDLLKKPPLSAGLINSGETCYVNSFV